MAAPEPLVPFRPRVRRFSARDAAICVGVAVLFLVLFEGRSVRTWGEEMSPGIGRSVVLAFGRPAGWMADRLPLADLGHRVTSWLSPEQDLGNPQASFSAVRAQGASAAPPVTPDAFDTRGLGGRAGRPRPLHTLLVTGDSMVMPLDLHLARSLATAGVRTIRDPHIGSGISKTIVVDWGRLSTSQVANERPDAVVVFIGANEGFPMRGPGGREVPCCGADWAAIYATRARLMMNTYRQRGAVRVYWLTLPAPREPARQRVVRAVNAAVEVAAEPYRAQVRVLDMSAVFTPGGRFRSAMAVGGRQEIVRNPDGIHLNDVGAGVAAAIVLRAVRADYGKP